MSTLDSIKTYFSRRRQDIYCQNCGTELTNVGGDLTDSGRIYCHGNDGVEISCFVQASFLEQHPRVVQEGFCMVTMATFYSPREVQRAIKNRELIQFGKLEQTIETT